jgi:hypothetical protein
LVTTDAAVADGRICRFAFAGNLMSPHRVAIARSRFPPDPDLL